MVVIQGAEEIEGIAFGIAGIEEDYLVSTGPVVFLITVQEVAGTEIRIDISDTVQEDIRTDESVIDFVDMLHDLAMDVLHELVAVGQVMQDLRYLVGHFLVLVEGVLQQGSIPSERLSLHEAAKLLENIKRKDIDIVPGTLDALLDGGNLLTHLVFLIAGIEVEIEIVEEISALGILECLAAQFVVQLLNGHRCHMASCFNCSILYPGKKQA